MTTMRKLILRGFVGFKEYWHPSWTKKKLAAASDEKLFACYNDLQMELAQGGCGSRLHMEAL